MESQIKPWNSLSWHHWMAGSIPCFRHQTQSPSVLLSRAWVDISSNLNNSLLFGWQKLTSLYFAFICSPYTLPNSDTSHLRQYVWWVQLLIYKNNQLTTSHQSIPRSNSTNTPRRKRSRHDGFKPRISSWVFSRKLLKSSKPRKLQPRKHKLQHQQ